MRHGAAGQWADTYRSADAKRTIEMSKVSNGQNGRAAVVSRLALSDIDDVLEQSAWDAPLAARIRRASVIYRTTKKRDEMAAFNNQLMMNAKS